jgi:TonB family protein
VASAGFGNGVATQHPGTGNGANRAQVAQAGFGDARPALDAPRAQKPAAPAVAPVTPIEIIFKPKPVYTEEARLQHIEGEVLLEVLFPATGEPRVLRMVRGLGHGLDEAAIRAAQQIRYRPALREGQPVDFTSTIHVMFAMAY